MTTIALSQDQDAITETYHDVKKLITYVCKRFQSGCSEDFHDLIATANLAFVKAYRSYTTGKNTKFTSYLCTIIWRDLCTKSRKEYGQRSHIINIQDIELFAALEDIEWNLRDFAELLSLDSKTVMQLIFNTPKEIAKVAKAKGDHANNLRSTIRDHLLNIGWTTRRVRLSFSEIRQLLSSDW